jgi:hypothetical protein
MGQNSEVFGRLRRWRRGSSQELSANNVVSGVARDVVQAGYVGHVSFNRSGDEALELIIPSLDTIESLLSFANTTVEYVGRAGEFEELKGFWPLGRRFPGGSGRARLASAKAGSLSNCAGSRRRRTGTPGSCARWTRQVSPPSKQGDRA